MIESTEQSTEIQELQQDPTDQSCPFCGSFELPVLSKEASFLTYVLVLISICLFGLMSIIILPLIVQSSKTIVKRCIDCEEVIEQRELFAFPSLKDEVMNFRCGNCSLIISRKYALIFILLFCIIWGIMFVFGPATVKVQQEWVNTEENPSWVQFVEDCGRNQVLSNEMKAKNSFQNKFDY